jgi:hypothetical protein
VRIGSESVLAENPPYYVDQSLAQSNGSTTPSFILKNGFPAFSATNHDLTKTTVHAQDLNQRTPYVEQVSFGPQIEFSENTVLDVSYVCNFGRKEDRLRNANQRFVTGFLLAGTAITAFPYPNLNTSVNSLSGNHAFLELATNDGT